MYLTIQRWSILKTNKWLQDISMEEKKKFSLFFTTDVEDYQSSTENFTKLTFVNLGDELEISRGKFRSANLKFFPVDDKRKILESFKT